MLRLRVLPALLLALTVAACSSTRPTVEPAPAPEAPAAETPVVEAEAPAAPDVVPEDWIHLDAATAPYRGVATDRAYQLVQNRAADTVVVAVIDSGVDVEHEDLRMHVWTNDDEIPGNGLDDDGNGYVDDVHGWSFLGGPDGQNVSYDTYEVTRELARLQARFEGIEAADVAPEDAEAYAYYQEVQEAYAQKRAESEGMIQNVAMIDQAAQEADAALRAHFGKDEITPEDLAAIDAADAELARARDVMRFLEANGITVKALNEYHEHLKADLEYRLNLDFDPRGIVGDDPADLTERVYGNADVAGPDPSHGTHVAGIIAADRTNDLGARGVAAPVEIMVVRAVPDGDERDKDVANAIRYAVDNGADVVNMSFGKDFSPQKDAVDAAVRYAVERGVLLVHAAGNDGADLDVAANFPSGTYGDGADVPTWVSVGATTSAAGEGFVAPFSNYGQASVDLFAPGDDIFSTLPGQTYGDQQGTSMAAPVVTGVAALVMAYYPDLTAAQVKDVLLRSATRYAGEQVVRPGTPDEAVAFETLSVTGGVVNAYEALRLAEELSKGTN